MSTKRVIPKLPPDFDVLKHANTQESILDKQQIIIDSLKEENAHLKEELEMYSGYKEGDADNGTV